MQKKQQTITRRKLRSSYATSIISISLVLFLLGLVGLLLLNAQRLSIHVKENIGFSVILKDEAKEVDIIGDQAHAKCSLSFKHPIAGSKTGIFFAKLITENSRWVIKELLLKV